MSKPTSLRGTITGGPAAFLDNPSSNHALIELMDVDEAAAFLTISRSSVRRLQQSRQLPFIKVGGSLRFAKADLLAYLAKRRVVLDA